MRLLSRRLGMIVRNRPNILQLFFLRRGSIVPDIMGQTASTETDLPPLPQPRGIVLMQEIRCRKSCIPRQIPARPARAVRVLFHANSPERRVLFRI
jgi:hypothetical protein